MPEQTVHALIRLLLKEQSDHSLHCFPFDSECLIGVALTLKAPITTEADDIHKYFFHCFSEKIRLDVSSESSARQRIHMKNQALFSLKDKNKKFKCRLLQFLFGPLRVKRTIKRASAEA